jgi:hypothetical protein
MVALGWGESAPGVDESGSTSTGVAAGESARLGAGVKVSRMSGTLDGVGVSAGTSPQGGEPAQPASRAAIRSTMKICFRWVIGWQDYTLRALYTSP